MQQWRASHLVRPAEQHGAEAAATRAEACWTVGSMGRCRVHLREADVHLPFLLRIASVPDEVLGNLVVNGKTSAAKMELEEDDELGVTEEELAAEAEAVPQMMKHAQ
eukprot:3382062-Pleurochrysis_carterae.AAC.1